MNLLTICVTLSDRYKSPILREICICISNLNIYMRSFKKKLLFELSINATLSQLIISKSHYGLSLILPSTKFIQCQTTIRNALKSSPYPDIRYIWQDSSKNSNIQYDQYRNAKQVLKAVQK